MLIRKLSIPVVFIITMFSSFGQLQDARIADEYYIKGDLEKAIDYYEKLVKDERNIPIIYENFFSSMIKLERYDDAEKFLKKQLKSHQQSYQYNIDLGVVYLKQKNPKQAEKQFEEARELIKINTIYTQKIATYFMNRGLMEQALLSYGTARKSQKNPRAYALDVADIYRLQGKTSAMIDEVLNYCHELLTEPVEAQNYLQTYLTTEDDYKLLEKKCYTRIQSNPDKIGYNRLLFWLYMQRQDFENAFMQAKAIDKRYSKNGAEILQLGEIALKNKAYEQAADMFSYVYKQYNNYWAKQRMIESKELMIENTYPLDTTSLKELLTNYQTLEKELTNFYKKYEVRKNMARINGLYLGKYNEAIAELEEISNYQRLQTDFRSSTKVLLGDIYLLANDPWEATLRYSQAEKLVGDVPEGHIAKLKNAKFNYYIGNFELAQAQLDILKLNTDREISNDAIEMSLLIKDNLAMDTTNEVLEEYAAIDLLIFQKKYDKALLNLNGMLLKYPKHSLVDEIYWSIGQIYEQTGRDSLAINSYKKLIKDYKQDIFTDNAYYAIAKIYHHQLGQKDLAMEYYKDLLINFPGSVFAADARKQYRKLRGDSIN